MPQTRAAFGDTTWNVLVQWRDRLETFSFSPASMRKGARLYTEESERNARGHSSPRDMRTFRYAARVTRWDPDSTRTLECSYRPKDKHPAAIGNDRWGTATFSFNLDPADASGIGTGTADWTDNDDSSTNGSGTLRYVSSSAAATTVQSSTTRRAPALQDWFRALLSAPLGLVRCELSRCEIPALVEAAHIKPVADGGEFVRENGMLLRADLHRLFDAGLLRISADSGKVVLDPKTCESLRDMSYAQSIGDYALDQEALKRVAPALRSLRPIARNASNNLRRKSQPSAG